MHSVTHEHLTPISALELRRNIGEILERVHYRGEQFQIKRKDKPMARVVNDDLMRAIEELIESDPATADTLALMLDDEAMHILYIGEQEWQHGERLRLEDVLA
jgi:antitoxin (DNA-binding transcriptional repressor) of toxin-antitoxin stability system